MAGGMRGKGDVLRLLPRHVTHADCVARDIGYHRHEDDQWPDFTIRSRGVRLLGANLARQMQEIEGYGAQSESDDHDGDAPKEDTATSDAVDVVEGDEGKGEVGQGDRERR